MDSDRIEELTKDNEEWEEDRLIYDDPAHKDVALSSLNTLRRNRDFCDVVLQVDHTDIHVHRAVLACQSRFFYELFSESEESEQKSLPFHYKMGDQLDLAAFETLINYAYTSRLEITTDRVKAVYKTALVLKMETPMAVCAKYLIENLSVENCLGIRLFANSHYDANLSSQADSFIRSNILQIIEGSQEFRSLPKIKVEVVSTNEEDSRSYNEFHVSSLVLDWLKRNIQGNHDRLEEVDNDVNLLYLHSDNTLHDCIECNDNDDSAALNNSEIIQDYKKTSNKRTMSRNELSSNNLVGMGNGNTGQGTGNGHSGQGTGNGHSGRSRSGSEESLHSGTESSLRSGENQNEFAPLFSSPKNGHGVNASPMDDHINGLNRKQVSPTEFATDSNPKVPSKQHKKRQLKKSKYSAKQEQEWKVIALTKPSEKSILAIFILGQCDLAGISIKMRYAPKEAPSLGAASSTSISSISTIDQPSVGSGAPLSTQSTAPTTPVGSGSPLSASLGDGLNFQGIALPEMEFARCGMGAGSIGNKLVVCGGYGRGECLDTVEQFDPVSLVWTRLPDMLTPRGRFSSVVIDGQVYVVGGSDGSSELHSVEAYDPKTNRWEHVTDLPQPRSSAGVCALLGLLVVIGGSSDSVTSSKYCMAYDPKKSKWHQIASLNQNRNQLGVCSHNGQIYVAGGTDSWNCLNTVEVYDPKTDRWTFLPPMNTQRRGCDLSLMDNRLFVVGGSDGSRSLGSTEVFDFATGQWTIGPPLNIPRANLRTIKMTFEGEPCSEVDANGAGATGTHLFAIGGFDGKGFLKSMEVLTTSGPAEWQTYINLTRSATSEMESNVFPLQ